MTDNDNKDELSVSKEPQGGLPLVAHGDLNVETQKQIAGIPTFQKPHISKFEKTKEILPPIGTKFMVNGEEYKVVYINIGKKRFTSTPCSGQY
jgi:hypothetical protein